MRAEGRDVVGGQLPRGALSRFSRFWRGVRYAGIGVRVIGRDAIPIVGMGVYIGIGIAAPAALFAGAISGSGPVILVSSVLITCTTLPLIGVFLRDVGESHELDKLMK